MANRLPELPGFYYDQNKKKYFKITSSNNNVNVFTTEALKEKENKEKHQEATAVKHQDLNLFRALYKLPYDSSKVLTFKKTMLWGNVQNLNLKRTLPMPPRYSGEGGLEFKKWLPLAHNKLMCLFSESNKPGSYLHALEVQPCCSKRRSSKICNPQNIEVKFKGFAIESDEDITSFCNIPYRTDNSPSHLLMSSIRTVPNSAATCNMLRICGMDDQQLLPDCQHILSAQYAIWCTSYDSACEKVSLGTEIGNLVLDTTHWDGRWLPTKSSVLCQCFSEDGNILLAGTKAGLLCMYDLRSPIPVWTEKYSPFKCGSGIFHTSLLNNCLLVGSFGEKIHKVDLRNFHTVITYNGHNNTHRLNPFRVDTDLDILYMAGEDKLMRVWNLTSGELVNTFAPPEPLPKHQLPTMYIYSDSWCNHSFVQMLCGVGENICVYGSAGAS